MKDPREKEIKALTEKYLKIRKEFRLIGEDGRIHLPAVPDNFYIEEVANWLSYAPKFSIENHSQRACDYVMESKGYSHITTINIDIDNSEPGNFPGTGKSNTTYLQLFAPLELSQLSLSELPIDQLLHNSYSHHRFLFKALRTIRENHTAFIETLSNKFDIPVRVDHNYFSDVLRVLRKANRMMLQLEEQGHYNFIPMLYALRDHGVLMSTNLNSVFKYEVEEWGLLYSYGFSTQTAHAVLVILKDFFALQIRRYEALVGKSSIELPANAPTTIDERKIIFVPTGTKEKMKLVRDILGLKAAKDESSEICLKPFQVMLLLRTFQDKNFIRPKIDKYQFALAYEILTGGSSAYFEHQYQTDKIDAVKLKKWSKKKQLKKAIECVSELQQKITSDILPMLSEFEKLSP